MLKFSKADTTSLFPVTLRQKKQVSEEKPVCIAETIIQMQRSRRDFPSFVDLVSKTSSAIKEVMLKFAKNNYKIGDIVYFKNIVLSANPIMSRYLGTPFIIVGLPLDTQNFKTYTLRHLDQSNEDCWVDYYYHEDFFTKENPNA